LSRHPRYCYGNLTGQPADTNENLEGEIMKRPIAILLVVLLIIGLLFSTYALFQGKFAEALFIYPLLIVAYLFSRFGKK